MWSTHEAKLDMPLLPTIARHCHIVPELTLLPLVSIGQLCDAGCIVQLNATTATITFNGVIIMTGRRTTHTNLWHFDLAPSLRMV